MGNLPSIDDEGALYRYIREHPNQKIEDLVEGLNLSKKKVHKHLKELIKAGLVKESPSDGGTATYLYVHPHDLINWDLLPNTKKPGKYLG